MEPGLVDAAAHGGDLSLWSLFFRADIVVKSVMIALVLASIWSWAIIFDKWITLGKLRRRAKRFEATFWSGEGLEQLYRDLDGYADHPLAVVFVNGMREWQRARSLNLPVQSLRDRMEQSMSLAFSRELETLENRLSFLATVGSVAPFIGLFGTVWGIMNSFSAIAASQNTSLVVVAPGIAEALFATALGLFAAIPAVVFYNKLTGDIAKYANRVDVFAQEFIAVISRELERRAA